GGETYYCRRTDLSGAPDRSHRRQWGPIPGSPVAQTPKPAASPSQQTGTTPIAGRPKPEGVAAMLSRAANPSRRTNWAGWTEALRHANGVSGGLGDGGESRG